MTAFRRFRNDDPPALAEVWNEAFPNRGAYPLRNPSLLDRWVFSKPYFDAAGLVVAAEPDGRVVGFALAGFAPNADLNGLDRTTGVVCFVAVRPSHRRKGVGLELLNRAEAYLTGGGATTILAGASWPNCPFGLGVYGGGGSPGFLASDPAADPFLKAVGYGAVSQTLCLQRRLDQPLTVADPRFNMLRRRYDIQMLRAATVTSWWHECVWGVLEPVEFRVVDKLTGIPAARAVMWELEGYGWRWGFPAAGIFDVQVRPDLRRQGLGKLLVSQMLRFLQDQFFGIAEMQAPADRPDVVGLGQAMGMGTVDVGTVYQKLGPGALQLQEPKNWMGAETLTDIPRPV